jgi:hypothetical protein
MRVVRKGPWKATDAAGTVYRVEQHTEMISTANFEGGGYLPGLSKLVTSCGLDLNYKGKGEYEIVESGAVIRSSDPNAP